jgi:hypothetical protein
MRSIAIGLVTAALVVPTAGAAWSQHGLGNGASQAKTLSSGNVPTISVAVKKVTVTWTASTFTTGGNVPGYIVRRYNATTGTLQTIGANCSHVIATTTCTENNTPTGLWQYSVTPAAGNWRGGESGRSATAAVI